MAYRVGVDVGGTFTDLMLFDEGSGRYWRHKTPSTPHDPSLAVLDGIAAICTQAGVEPTSIAQIMHGTTVATNVVLEGKGARVGLVTTEGFEQILHLARSQTPGPLVGWMIMIKPEPPASLADTREVPERMSAQGEVVRDLDEAAAEAAIDDLVGSGIESLTISLINSFANSGHEKRLKANRPARRPRPAGLDLVRDAARVPRVRAGPDDGDERLCHAEAYATTWRTWTTSCAGRA